MRAPFKQARRASNPAEAAVEQAQLNLGFTKVRSLIDGIAGIASIQIGNLVGPTTVLTTVSAVDPIKASFSISEQEYLALADKIRPGAAGDMLFSRGSEVPLRVHRRQRQRLFSSGHTSSLPIAEWTRRPGTIRIIAAFGRIRGTVSARIFGRIRAMTGFR